MSCIIVRRSFIGIFLAAASGTCASASAQDQLAAYLGPKDGQTYVYSLSGDENSKLKQVTVAGVAGKDGLLTCSPASAAEYPDEARKLGARPVVARISVRDDAMVSTHGGISTTLLKLPLTPNASHWTNHQVANLPGGVRKQTTLSCGISSVAKGSVLGVERNTVAVTCASEDQGVKTVTTYAEGVGPIEEDMEALSGDGRSVGLLTRKLTAVQSGVAECAALVAQKPAGSDPAKGSQAAH
jgi:hypothetical protein